MKRQTSYRQKLIELAKIYKLDQVFESGSRLTTYEIELVLLKNKVPLPTRRSYLAHLIINEIIDPIYHSINKTRLDIVESINKFFRRTINNTKRNYFNLIDGINSFFRKIYKGIIYFFFDLYKAIIFNIKNFFSIIFTAIIDGLNSLYNFNVNRKNLDKLVQKAAYASLVLVLVYGGFFLKGYITDNLDSFKISVEIKSDKEQKEEKIVKVPSQKTQDELIKEKEPEKKETAKLQDEYNPNDDYSLNTQTVMNLFEDLEYSLDEVRDVKQVKPIYFTRLPKDLDKIRSVTRKKETFLQIVLPLIVAENEKIENDREYLFKIITDNDSEEKRVWLSKKFREYKVQDNSISELIEKIDIVPTSIALAQAAKESGWGTSRFALEGNAIFGQWTFNGVGIEPLEKDDDKTHKILKFPILRASVKAYITNLNTHPSYKGFREKRQEARDRNKKPSGIDLIDELESYAETGKEYTKILKQIIEQNNLEEFEPVTINNSQKENQLKL
ncbi:MAG: glucosaminidase domain-containing protein [Pelagibacteraceae bacterium]